MSYQQQNQPKIRECENCKAVNVTARIYFLKKGEIPDGRGGMKNDWALMNENGTPHTHAPGAPQRVNKTGGTGFGGKSGFGGYRKKNISRVYLCPYDNSDPETAAKNQEQALQGGFQFNVLSNGQVQFEEDKTLGTKLIVMVKENA